MGKARSKINSILRGLGYEVVRIKTDSNRPELIHERMKTHAIACMKRAVLEDCDSHGIQVANWSDGIEFELDFWWQNLSENLLGEGGEGFRKGFLLDRDLDHELPPSVAAGQAIEALDIGCAVNPVIGKRCRGHPVSVLAVDPLASAYNSLLNLYNVELGFTLDFGVAETIADRFGAERFDLIVAENCLDHGFDPLLSISQICAALKIGGMARFRHFLNEGEMAQYGGFHQWNIEPAPRNGIRVWNRTQSTFVDFGAYGCDATVELFNYKREGAMDSEGVEVSLTRRA